MLEGEPDAAVVEEIGEGVVAVGGYLHLVLLRPDDDAHQRHEYVQRRVQLPSIANQYKTEKKRT